MDFIACGYGWTGSGAVIAMLRSQPNIRLLPFGELQLIKYPGGLGSLYAEFKENGFCSQRGLSNLAKVILGTVGKEMPQSERCRKNMGQFAANLGDRYTDLYADLMATLVQHANSPREWFDKKLFLGYIKKYIAEFLALNRQNSTERLIIDQAIRPTKLLQLHFINAKMMIVDRDPRDSFFDRQQSQIVNRPTLQQYVSKLTDRREKTKNLIGNSAFLKSRVRLVRFEEFVLSESYRKELCDWLDIESPVLDGGLFKSAKSKNNIGIYTSDANQAPYETIAHQFSDMLWKA